MNANSNRYSPGSNYYSSQQTKTMDISPAHPPSCPFSDNSINILRKYRIGYPHYDRETESSNTSTKYSSSNKAICFPSSEIEVPV